MLCYTSVSLLLTMFASIANLRLNTNISDKTVIWLFWLQETEINTIA
jgi:hypothetical protein